MAEVSTKPYLIRALYEWCADNGYRPYIAVVVDERTQVPREFVRDGEIVLNISAAATNRLAIGNELVEFEARFGGVARHVSIPIENVSAIFAQENGHGMAFEVPKKPAVPQEAPGEEAREDDRGTDASGDETEGARGAGTDAASLPAGDDAAEAEAGAGPKPAPGRARKRPKLAAVPAPGEQTTKPARRKGTISAVPAVPKPGSGSSPKPATGDAPAGDAGAAPRSGSAAPQGERTTPPDAGPTDEPGDDGPGPATTPPGRPRLTRVK